jgi:hypothetical protein
MRPLCHVAGSGGGCLLLIRYRLGLAMSSIDGAVAKLRGWPSPPLPSPPDAAAAAGTTVDHVTGIISILAIREASSSCSSAGASAAGRIVPASHGIESVGRVESLAKPWAGGNEIRYQTSKPYYKKLITQGVGNPPNADPPWGEEGERFGGLGFGSWEH